MKVHPKRNPYEDYINEGDLEGFTVDYIYPKRFDERRDLEVQINKRRIFEDDLIDVDVEIETRKKNAAHKFTEKIPLSEYDLLSDEAKTAYHQFLIDYSNENLSNSRQT